MIKNIVIGILAVALVAETGFGIWKWKQSRPEETAEKKVVQAPPRPSFLSKGDKLADSPTAKVAYKIAPGDLDAQAKTALVGWTITSKIATDSSVVVSLVPKNSDDQAQQYTVRPGYSLYFVESTPVDDHADSDTDSNLRDDYGIIVDGNGVVQ